MRCSIVAAVTGSVVKDFAVNRNVVITQRVPGYRIKKTHGPKRMVNPLPANASHRLATASFLVSKGENRSSPIVGAVTGSRSDS